MINGRPESWYSWRHVIRPIANAGFRVFVPDMRGYGNTDCPSDVSAYRFVHFCVFVNF